MKEDEEEGEGHPSASAKCSISVISYTNAVYPRLHIFNVYIDYLYSIVYRRLVGREALCCENLTSALSPLRRAPFFHLGFTKGFCQSAGYGTEKESFSNWVSIMMTMMRRYDGREIERERVGWQVTKTRPSPQTATAHFQEEECTSRWRAGERGVREIIPLWTFFGRFDISLLCDPD